MDITHVIANKPHGEKRATFTVFVCLSKLDKKTGLSCSPFCSIFHTCDWRRPRKSSEAGSTIRNGLPSPYGPLRQSPVSFPNDHGEIRHWRSVPCRAIGSLASLVSLLNRHSFPPPRENASVYLTNHMDGSAWRHVELLLYTSMPIRTIQDPKEAVCIAFITPRQLVITEIALWLHS